MTDTFDDILRRRYTRRELLHAGALAAPGLLLLPDAVVAANTQGTAAATRGLAFHPVTGSSADAIEVAAGYDADVLVRWGDPVFPGAPALDPRGLVDGSLLKPGSAAAQARQFGYNCDAIEFFPLERSGRRGLLCVNHEYTNDELIFPDRLAMGREGAAVLAAWSKSHPEATRLGLAAHGVSVLEIELVGTAWRPKIGSRYTRRITGTTPVDIRGQARGHALLRTKGDPTGTRVLGTLANCSGGRTPWGTYLTAEENFQDYFGGMRTLAADSSADARVLAAHRRFPMHEGSYHGWEHVDTRFDLRVEPGEALRFGWMVEIDPENPRAPIRKRTALGRFAHESAACTPTRDGRVALYMGDDDAFEYVYKFVSAGRWNPRHRAANSDLLDAGVLHVARFDADGTGEWLPLVHGQGPLTPRNGFVDAGEVLIKARVAADLLGATPMDRPEDIAVHPVNGNVYVALTKNSDRSLEAKRNANAARPIDHRVDAANPRPQNEFGHILEIQEEGEDAGARRFRWNVFLLPGDPAAADARHLARPSDLAPGTLGAGDTYYAGYAGLEPPAPMACPDNLEFDGAGNLWIVTDGKQPHGRNNGTVAVPVAGPERGYLRQFMSGPVGAEICGCEFTPDGETLFLSIQHPGEGGTVRDPVSHWPDGNGLPPRPSVVAIRKRGGGRIGS
ncbi:MAG TPA: PhoX family phosphatase [Steroidobacteraceae bacterium]